MDHEQTSLWLRCLYSYDKVSSYDYYGDFRSSYQVHHVLEKPRKCGTRTLQDLFDLMEETDRWRVDPDGLPVGLWDDYSDRGDQEDGEFVLCHHKAPGTL